MDLKKKISAFLGAALMGAITHITTSQLEVFQKKTGLSANPHEMGVQLAEKFLKSPEYKKVVSATPTVVKRSPASVGALNKFEHKLCDFRSSYIEKDSEGVRKNFRGLQDLYFKDKELTEKKVNEFVTKVETYLASGKYDNKKVPCP